MKLNIDQSKVKEIVEKIVEKIGLKIYEINIVKDYESNVLQILLEHIDGNPIVSFDLLVEANEKIGNALDEDNSINDKYILEVSSAGIEKKIRSQKELDESIGKYLFIESKEHKLETNATLIEKKDDLYLFQYLLKGQIKKVKISYDEIDFVRFAVKF